MCCAMQLMSEGQLHELLEVWFRVACDRPITYLGSILLRAYQSLLITGCVAVLDGMTGDGLQFQGLSESEVQGQSLKGLNPNPGMCLDQIGVVLALLMVPVMAGVEGLAMRAVLYTL